MSERDRPSWTEATMLARFRDAVLAEGWAVATREGPDEAPTTFVFTQTTDPLELLLSVARLVDAAASCGWLLRRLDVAPASHALQVAVSAAVQPSHPLVMARATAASSAKRKAARVRVGRPPAIAEGLLQRIVREHEAGRTYRQLARDFEVEGIPTPRGGPRWYASTVRSAYLRAGAESSS
jgi:hypothetical protein